MATAQTKLQDQNEHTVLQFKFDSFQTKEEGGNSFAFFSGYASVFNNTDGHGDVIAPNAFKESLQSIPHVKLLWQHDTSAVIGSITSLKEDTHGLHIEARINLGTAAGKEAYALLKAGDLDSMSIGYRTIDTHYDKETGIRTIKSLKLYEVSVVTFPANTQAKILSVKSIEKAESLSDIEDILKTKGFSNKQAKALIGKIKAFAPQTRDEDGDAQRDVEETKSAATIINHIQSLIKEINHV